MLPGSRRPPRSRFPRTELTSPTVSALEPGRIDLFWRTSEGRLAHRYRPVGGSWTRELDLWGHLASQPAAVSWAPERLDVFARGTDHTLIHRWYRNGRWSHWESLGGRLTSAPAAASWAPGRLDVFARAGNGALLHRFFRSGEGWSPWRWRGGTLTSSPAATSWGEGRIDVVARGTNSMTRPQPVRGWMRHTRPASASLGRYLPAYGDMARNVRRTVAIVQFTCQGGQRFDAVGVDIERLDEVSRSDFNRLLVTHLTRVRARTDTMLAATVPPPFATTPGTNWAGLP